MRQSQSIYSGLSASKGAQRDVYEGQWKGKTVRFDRVFRNHRFTDDECKALCNDEMLEIHDLERNGVHYAVVGCLQMQPYLDTNGMPLARFKADHTISYDPEYTFENRMPRKADGSAILVGNKGSHQSSSYVFDDDLDPFKLDEEQAQNEAFLSALLQEPIIPRLVKLPGNGDLPVFVPFITLMTEEEIQEVAKRAGAVPWDGDPWYDSNAI